MVDLVQSRATQTTGTSLSRAFNPVPAPGDLLVAVHCAANLQATVTPPTGWTIVGGAGHDDDGLTFSGALYYKISDGTETAVTVSTVGSGQCALNMHHWTGARFLMDRNNLNDPSGTGLTCSTGTTGTLTAAVEVVIAACFSSAGLGAADATWDNGLTATHSGALPRLVTGVGITAATTAINPTLTWTPTARARFAGIATFTATEYAGWGHPL